MNHYQGQALTQAEQQVNDNAHCRGDYAEAATVGNRDYSRNARSLRGNTTASDAVDRVERRDQLSRICHVLERIADALEDQAQTAQRTPARTSRLLPNQSEARRETDRERWQQSVDRRLLELHQLLTADRGEVVKEAYTVTEVAQRTRLASYTIRQACNTGRIKNAFKGDDRAWRIPHAALLDILNHGLSAK